MQMMLTLLGGLLLRTDNQDEPTYDSSFMGYLLIIVNSAGFFALILSLLALHPKIRKRLNSSKSSNSSSRSSNKDFDKMKHIKAGSSATKVIPSSTINNDKTKKADIIKERKIHLKEQNQPVKEKNKKGINRKITHL
jgi:hypothetical protein